MKDRSLITSDIAAAYSLCKRKAFLLLTEEQGDPVHPYVALMEAQAAKSLETFLELCERAGLNVQRCNGAERIGTADVFANTSLKANGLHARIDALVRKAGSKRSSLNEPYLAIGRRSITHDDRIRLAFVAHVLGINNRHRPSTGVIVNATGNPQRIKLAQPLDSLERIISSIQDWQTAKVSSPPPVVLNKHCPICPFTKKCREQAECDDSLTLLDRMTPKVMQKYHQKGIFTITQLSYLFKPRKQRKRQKKRSTKFNLELQVLALRAGKIYVHEAPEIADHATELYLDIEGVPDDGSHYLIGVVVKSEQQFTERHSFWADSFKDEQRILEQFVEVANRHPGTPIYHYGSYEPKAIARMTKRFGANVDVLRRFVNVNTFIFGKVYFPTKSNTLKDLGRFCGASWSHSDSTGLQSVVWRMQWQLSGGATLKEQLLAYNMEDCYALASLVAELRMIGRCAASRADVDFADAPKQNTTPAGQHIHNSLERILKSAHAEFENKRIDIRREADLPTMPKKRGAPYGHPGFIRIIPAKVQKIVRVRRPMKCPRKWHRKVPLEALGEMAEHTIIDLAFSKNGCRKTVIKYQGAMGYCCRCRIKYPPPALKQFTKHLFGHCFRAWIVYQRIVLRLPYRTITEVCYDLFREQISGGTVIHSICHLANYYASTERKCLRRILSSPFIHVDETTLTIEGANAYVWVLTDGRHVVFRLTETRESTLIQSMLKDYPGVLISDFYGGYDACACRQQKCLVHLIRDLNDDLWKNSFNTELESFVGAVNDLLAPIMADVNKYGLKRRHLHKHERRVTRFFKNVIEGQEYSCEITRTYQKRFLRYRASLFRFLSEDGIPWNNNMAERASRPLAVQRKISGSFFKRVAEHYLRLLGIAQTCRFQGKSFLPFLLSKERDIHRYKERRRPSVTKRVVISGNGAGVNLHDRDKDSGEPANPPPPKASGTETT